MKNKVIAIVGPTASGKSSFGVKLAKMFDAEIISGDSVQIYKGFDIGSAKVTEEEKEGIKHYLIDELEPDASYSVYDFQKQARKHIEEIKNKGKLPIIVGGTGLYIRACLYDYEFSKYNHHNQDDDYENFTNEELYQRLLTIDKISALKIHPNNRRRVIRALSIYDKTSTTKSSIEAKQEHIKLYDVMFLGKSVDRKILYNRIGKRVDKMFEEGLLEEVKNLLNNGCSFDNQAFKAIGYKEFKGYFDGVIDLNEVKRLIIKNTKNYAKRQETWFKNQEDVGWIDDNNEDEVLENVKRWLYE